MLERGGSKESNNITRVHHFIYKLVLLANARDCPAIVSAQSKQRNVHVRCVHCSVAGRQQEMVPAEWTCTLKYILRAAKLFKNEKIKTTCCAETCVYSAFRAGNLRCTWCARVLTLGRAALFAVESQTSL